MIGILIVAVIFGIAVGVEYLKADQKTVRKSLEKSSQNDKKK